MKDEYFEEGKSLAELCELTENDPWYKPPSPQSKEAEKAAEIQRQIMDRLEQEGYFKEIELADLPDDEDMIIKVDTEWSIFWRITILGRKIVEAADAEPLIKKLAICYRNNQAGCWAAFTGAPLASHIEKSLNAQGFQTHMALEGLEFRNRQPIIESRPWNDLSGESEIKPEEFIYCIREHRKKVKVFFVPVSYWNEKHGMYDGDLLIADLVDDCLYPTRYPHCFESKKDMLHTKAFLDRTGFRENLLFQTFINDHLLD